MQLCFATNNAHKLQEVRNILGEAFEILDLKSLSCFEDLPETSTTFEGNSKQKAQYVFDHYHVPCIADDSGLEVDALEGAPGVYSARYAGIPKNDAENNALLLKNLQGVKDRKARFRTVITFRDNMHCKTFEGTIEGHIVDQPRGTQGFGYDPLFVPQGFNKTFAEMTAEEKNALSHRSVAVKKLVAYLRTL